MAWLVNHLLTSKWGLYVLAGVLVLLTLYLVYRRGVQAEHARQIVRNFEITQRMRDAAARVDTTSDGLLKRLRDGTF